MIETKRVAYFLTPYLFAACFAAVWFVLSQSHKSFSHLEIGFQKHIPRAEWNYYIYPHSKTGSTVPNSVNIAVRFTQLVLFCALNIFLLKRVSSKFCKALVRSNLTPTFANGNWWTYANFYMCDVWDLFHSAFLGALVSGFLVSCLKNMVGEPRPDFFDRCFPDVGVLNNAKINKKLDEISDNVTNPIKWTDICSSTDKKTVLGGLLSFPSGHANNSIGGAIFAALYIWGKLGAFGQKYRTDFWRFLAAFPSLIFGIWVAATRLTDYKHHAVDIFTGGLIGTVSSIVVYFMYFMPLTSDLSHLSYHQVRWCMESENMRNGTEESKSLSGSERKKTMLDMMKRS